MHKIAATFIKYEAPPDTKQEREKAMEKFLSLVGREDLKAGEA